LYEEKIHKENFGGKEKTGHINPLYDDP